MLLRNFGHFFELLYFTSFINFPLNNDATLVIIFLLDWTKFRATLITIFFLGLRNNCRGRRIIINFNKLNTLSIFFTFLDLLHTDYTNKETIDVGFFLLRFVPFVANGWWFAELVVGAVPRNVPRFSAYPTL